MIEPLVSASGLASDPTNLRMSRIQQWHSSDAEAIPVTQNAVLII
eukprot:SAG31_NODE_457_length_15415_cov_4.380387_21_plen_45_part_00